MKQSGALFGWIKGAKTLFRRVDIEIHSEGGFQNTT